MDTPETGAGAPPPLSDGLRVDARGRLLVGPHGQPVCGVASGDDTRDGFRLLPRSHAWPTEGPHTYNRPPSA